MLQANFIIKIEGGEEIKVANCTCAKCTNIFFVPNIGENEPSYCPYCGIKFIYYEGVDGDLKNLAGLPFHGN